MENMNRNANNLQSRKISVICIILNVFHLVPSGSDKFETVAKKLQLSKEAFRKAE